MVRSHPPRRGALRFVSSALTVRNTLPRLCALRSNRHDPWDNPDGIRTLLLRGIPAAMASLDIVVGWCALYGDVASIDLKPPAPLSAERDPLASPPATFAVVMYYKESHALRALRHIEHDVFSRINVRISARPFPTVHPDALVRLYISVGREYAACALTSPA